MWVDSTFPPQRMRWWSSSCGSVEWSTHATSVFIWISSHSYFIMILVIFIFFMYFREQSSTRTTFWCTKSASAVHHQKCPRSLFTRTTIGWHDNRWCHHWQLPCLTLLKDFDGSVPSIFACAHPSFFFSFYVFFFYLQHILKRLKLHPRTGWYGWATDSWGLHAESGSASVNRIPSIEWFPESSPAQRSGRGIWQGMPQAFDFFFLCSLEFPYFF